MTAMCGVRRRGPERILNGGDLVRQPEAVRGFCTRLAGLPAAEARLPRTGAL